MMQAASAFFSHACRALYPAGAFSGSAASGDRPVQLAGVEEQRLDLG
jgi:hypothetical protein